MFSLLKEFTFKQRIVIVLFFMMMLTSYPYIVSYLLAQNWELYWIPFVVLLFLCSSPKGICLPKDFLGCITLQVIGWLFFYLYHNDGSYITRILFVLLAAMALNGVQATIGVRKMMDLNNKVLTLQAVLGGIAFILVFVGVLRPLFEYIQQDLRPAYFFGITCSNTIVGNLIRPAGFFDEPGALAAWGMYALVINKVFIGNQKLEYMLTASLLFTLSLAYYIQLLLYFVLFNMKNIKNALLVGILVLSAYAYVSSDVNSELYSMTIGRMDTLQDGGLEASNRGRMIEISKNYFYENPWMGLGAQKTQDRQLYSSDNPYETLGTDGIIGTFIMYVPLLYVLIKRKNYNVLFAIFVLAVGYLQRPFHLNIMHYVIMYSFCILSLSSKIINKKEYATVKNICSHNSI